MMLNTDLHNPQVKNKMTMEVGRLVLCLSSVSGRLEVGRLALCLSSVSGRLEVGCLVCLGVWRWAVWFCLTSVSRRLVLCL